ncbi:HAD family hydrolase [Terrisporobacter glycolicus]|uniref:Pyrophosphatase PpaX n=1 Tax=Terrisporobacter glycolicus ATCC 14880 = DSM 1288 TaxID=1121315 RepID=A0ABZ2EYL4_9FIRM|nr:HAD family hydrolase [Terrisporobacter glycolicus]
MYKLIIFDIDGTLLDTESAVLKGLQKCLKEHHDIKVNLEELEFAIGMPGDEVFSNFGIRDNGFSYSKWVKYIDDYKEDIKLFDEIKDTLEYLRKNNVILAIATSKTRFEYDTTVKHFNINHYFDYVVCIDEVEHPKPSADPLLKIIQQSKISAKDALFIGDTYYDIECARNAQMDFGLALWGAHEKCKSMCGIHFSTPKELCKTNILDSINV